MSAGCRDPVLTSSEEYMMSDFMKKFMAARNAITQKHGEDKPKKVIHDEMECPICKGCLQYSISSYNGHISAECKTSKCVSWIE